MANEFGPGHYPSTGAVTTRPTPAATGLPTDNWFAQCDASGNGGTKIDEMFLNFVLATLRKGYRNGAATGGELNEDMLAEAMARAASGGIHCVDSGAVNAHVVASPTTFTMPKTYFAGMVLSFAPIAANTGPATVNAFTIGSKAIRRPDGNALAGAELLAGIMTRMWYDPAAAAGAGAFRIFPWALPAAAVGGGSVVMPPDLLIRDERAAGAQGGSYAAANTWYTAVLQTVARNVISGASLASNVITLPAGSYFVKWRKAFYSSQGSLCRLYNQTDSAVVGWNLNAFSGVVQGGTITESAQVWAEGMTLFTIAAQKLYRLEVMSTSSYYVGITTALGQARNVSGVPEQHAEIEIYKYA